MKATHALSLAIALTIAGTATAQKKSSKTVTKSSTHRVVVVNGKKIVDERTENGKPVKGKGSGDVDVDIDVGVDAEEMIRKMRERMKRARARMGKLGGKLGGVDKSDSKTSTHTKRVVVKNGKVIVDEETRDGKPVKKGAKGSDNGSTKKDGTFEDLDTFDRSDRTKGRSEGLGKDRKKLTPRTGKGKSKVKVVLDTVPPKGK